MPRRQGGSPRVAVVVATYNRARLLERLLAALAAQVEVGEYEVVVVDDASTDETEQVLHRLASAASVPVLVQRLPRNAGPAAARNLGWRSTTAPLVAFTDDDCVPQGEWLAQLVAALAHADVVQGRTRPNPEQAASHGPFSRTLHVEAEDGFYQTCNIAYRREWLERMDGFDEDFRYPAGEDTELAWRAIEAGAVVSFAPEALVHHDVRPSSMAAAVRDTRRWESVVLAVRKHPPLRDRLHSRWFWRPAHPPALAAVAGVALCVVLPRRAAFAAAAAMIAPYVRYRLVIDPLPTAGPKRRVALLPAALVVDATEVAVCAVASVRYRCLVL